MILFRFALLCRRPQNDTNSVILRSMHRISAEIDAQIKAGAVDEDTIGDYELAAMKNGFYAGFAAAMGLQRARIQLALAHHRGQIQGAA